MINSTSATSLANSNHSFFISSQSIKVENDNAIYEDHLQTSTKSLKPQEPNKEMRINDNIVANVAAMCVYFFLLTMQNITKCQPFYPILKAAAAWYTKFQPNSISSRISQIITLPLNNKDSEIKEAVLYFDRHAIKIDPSLKDGDATRQKMLAVFEKELSVNYDIVQNFKSAFELKYPPLLSIETTSADPLVFSSLGDSLCFSNPAIFYGIPGCKAKTEEDLSQINQLYDRRIEKFDLDVQRFSLTHELMHICNNDFSTKNLFLTAVACTHIWLWISNYSNSLSWFSYLLASSLKSAALEATATIIFDCYTRHTETQADLQAICHLKSKKGGIAHFKNQIEKEDENHVNFKYLSMLYSHPSPHQRLNDIIAAIIPN